MKALVKAALGPMDVQQAKDVEVTLAGVRADKVKEETAAKAAKKGAGLLCFILCVQPVSFQEAIQRPGCCRAWAGQFCLVARASGSL